MGKRKVTVKKSVADSIAEIAWFIESKGLLATAEKFSDEAYDFIQHLANEKRSYALCREPGRAAMGYKCEPYKKKYTIVFLESEDELTICEFLPSKMLVW
mgnify:CR=1 FL=1